MIFTERSPKGLRVFESLQRNARALVERIEKTELNSEDLDQQTRSVIIMDSRHIILSSIAPRNLSARLDKNNLA